MPHRLTSTDEPSAREQALSMVAHHTGRIVDAKHDQYDAVAVARREHASWRLIGEALGIQTAGAHRRFSGRPCPKTPCDLHPEPIF